MAERAAQELIVVGGGIVGLTVAWQARAAGADVTLLERDGVGEGTSRVAAGMLAPVAEAEFGGAGRRLLELGLRSAELWPGFAAQLTAAADLDVGLRQTGTLLLARDADESLELDRQLDFRRSLGLPVERLRPSEARRLEPALAPALRAALDVPGDHAVDPRRVLAALRGACERAGVRIREHASVRRVLAGDRRVDGVELENGDRVIAGSVVLATGAWSATLEGLPEAVPIRPVKGQILRLLDPSGPGLLERVIRFEGGYVVPRGDGRYVLGATVEERGFELAPTAGGIYELLREARELVPGVTELEIEELSVGLRPGTPDNVPMIGHSGIDGLLWAAGHHRNGILLAPLTARLVVALLEGAARDGELLAACDPRRFGRGASPLLRPVEVSA